MNQPYSKYQCNSKNLTSFNQSSTSFVSNNILPDFNNKNISLQDSCLVRSMPHRPQNIYINPNSLASSGSVYINKKMFNINANVPVRSSFNDLSVKPLVSEKIHYNPKFLACNQQNSISMDSVCIPNSKNIHVNPNFAKKFNMSNFDGDPTDSNAFVSVPSHLKLKDSLNVYSTIKCRFTEQISPSPDLFDRMNINHNCSISEQSSSSTRIIQNRKDQNMPGNHQTKLPLDKYHKINLQPSESTFKITKYKIQRKCENIYNVPNRIPFSSVNAPTPYRKQKLNTTFKKIGKRKLVRKSLVQHYISSRRHSLPLMIQHSRRTIASRKRKNKIISQNKYKLIRCDNTKPHVAGPNRNKLNIPIKSKLKWKRSSLSESRSKDFVHIGKRKIVRKSILQSILDARRSLLSNSVKYSSGKNYAITKEKSKTTIKNLSSRYKVIRNASPISSKLISPHHVRHKSIFKINRKQDPINLNKFVTSKSIFFRMPPSLRLKIRLDEKIRKMALLKKVNNKKKCLYYNRFGYCKGLENGSCKKMHDPKSVSVCRRFLKGKCDGEGCKLSHNVVPEKMPTCHQFLAGVCVRSACPFLHVKLSDRLPICLNFLQGFCSLGDACTKRHQFVCPELDENGSCKIDKCPYPHPSACSNKKDGKPIFTKDPSKKIDKLSSAILSNENHTPADDIIERYFSDIKSSDKNCNSKVIRRNPETKDGINSVYNKESLLSFIPFS